MHELWDELDDSEFRAMIFLWSFISQKAHKTGQTELVFKTLTRMSGIKEAVLNRTVQKLAELNVISVRTVQAPCNHGEETALRNDTNVTNETNIYSSPPASVSLNFEALYKKYPRKEGKSKGLAVCKKRIKTIQQYDDLTSAIDRYAEHVRTQGTETCYVKHFSTFMNAWEDWLDPETGTGTGVKKTKDDFWAEVFGGENESGSIQNANAAS
jgi:hypothetical protein